MRVISIPAIATFWLCCPQGIAGQTLVHLQNDSLTYSNQPVTNREIDRRLTDDANEYRALRRVERYGLMDLAYPRDSLDQPAFKDFGVLLLTLVSQDNAELPPKRVYLS